MNFTEAKYVVIFTSKRTDDDNGYQEMAKQMEHLAEQQSGFLGMTSVKDAIGVTLSYWSSLEAIQLWKANSSHLYAQQKGQRDWYDWYKVEVCEIKRAYEYSSNPTDIT
ncbi:MAG: antibiotic biosynthesis monooxygenase family protein [Flavobacteriaceae bacterium]